MTTHTQHCPATATDLRILDRDDELWFIAADVCDAIGHSKPSMAVQGLDDDEVAEVNFPYLSSNGVTQNRPTLIISESGLYTLLLRSNKPQAKPFRRWVTKEVLPTIRRTGSYSLSTEPVPVKRARLHYEAAQLEARARALRLQADGLGLLAGQVSVWDWLNQRGQLPTDPREAGPLLGRLSNRARLHCLRHNLPMGETHWHTDHTGDTRRTCRPVKTYSPEVLEAVLHLAS